MPDPRPDRPVDGGDIEGHPCSRRAADLHSHHRRLPVDHNPRGSPRALLAGGVAGDDAPVVPSLGEREGDLERGASRRPHGGSADEDRVRERAPGVAGGRPGEHGPVVLGVARGIERLRRLGRLVELRDLDRARGPRALYPRHADVAVCVPVGGEPGGGVRGLSGGGDLDLGTEAVGHREVAGPDVGRQQLPGVVLPGDDQRVRPDRRGNGVGRAGVGQAVDAVHRVPEAVLGQHARPHLARAHLVGGGEAVAVLGHRHPGVRPGIGPRGAEPVVADHALELRAPQLVEQDARLLGGAGAERLRKHHIDKRRVPARRGVGLARGHLRPAAEVRDVRLREDDARRRVPHPTGEDVTLLPPHHRRDPVTGCGHHRSSRARAGVVVRNGVQRRGDELPLAARVVRDADVAARRKRQVGLAEVAHLYRRAGCPSARDQLRALVSGRCVQPIDHVQPAGIDEGHEQRAAVSGRDDRLGRGAGEAGVDLLGDLEDPAHQARDEHVLDAAHVLQVHEPAAAVPRDRQARQADDAIARPVHRDGRSRGGDQILGQRLARGSRHGHEHADDHGSGKPVHGR